MTFRIILLGENPQHVLNHIRSCGCLCRREATDWRGKVALIGQGRVWAVATLREIKPATLGKVSKDGTPAPQGYLWCFEDVRDVEGVAAPEYAPPAMFQNGAAFEPQMLAAGAQVELRRFLAPQTAQIAPLLPEPMVEITCAFDEPLSPAFVEKSGQFGMF